ncbi:hypothetical protein LIER_04078 [Lithospermum erythrorhizon]|uniref:Retroviral polymerase SH3-like domain-containing protein n=1 Tax=Lithospermum erythrorhizon TaxID=34254 RepID=A0AAV3NXA9_LITER
MNADENMQVLLNNLVHLGEVLQESDQKLGVQVGKSVSKLAKESNIQVVFNSKCCILQDFKTSKVLVVTKDANGLYILDPSSLSFHVNSTNKITLWHQRLGHPSDISRLPFPSSTSFSAEVLHLIHLDLWGPYKTKTMSGVAYFLTIVDDCSRAKFDMRALPGVFLGYPMGQKAYKIFDLINRKVVVFRDVKFYEHLFPYSPLFPKSSIVPVEHSAPHNHHDPLSVVLVNHEVDLPNFHPAAETHIEPIAQADIPCHTG